MMMMMVMMMLMMMTTIMRARIRQFLPVAGDLSTLVARWDSEFWPFRLSGRWHSQAFRWL
eukprot:4669821-Pyramimonas_sp.AAC.1